MVGDFLPYTKKGERDFMELKKNRKGRKKS